MCIIVRTGWMSISVPIFLSFSFSFFSISFLLLPGSCYLIFFFFLFFFFSAILDTKMLW
ncbi:hypothetical protein V8C34DRAFT_266050 [Trichoderma compactum]